LISIDMRLYSAEVCSIKL